MSVSDTRPGQRTPAVTDGRVLCLRGPADGRLFDDDRPGGTLIIVEQGGRCHRYRLTDAVVGSRDGWARAAEFIGSGTRRQTR